MITGHRGAKAIAPENTLISFSIAAHCGAKWIETDTQLSADLVPVIYHDKNINRCTNGSGIVRKLTVDELKKFDAGSWFDPQFSEETIPTLEELLICCDHNNLNLNLEVKVHDEDEAELQVEKTIDVIKAYGFPIEKLILSSFSYRAVKHFKAYWPEVRRGLIIEEWVPQIDRLDEELELFSIHLDHHLLTESLASEIKAAGKELHIWTMNDLNSVMKFRRWGVDNIITDNPGDLIPIDSAFDLGYSE
ncbi:TPA: glycerophosphodiester phosphodiesterase family protein [Photobacterium damselae]|uniref:glycerophosphodiester phosphodiesterase family protein n=1 Tax=Photobacterium damselae TaxID=38293 RepID=UPI00159393E9|nr:glycerophosphodiester phosphodiesterase family protein [Photobacterium damselae]NVH47319.1 glycerophosphoryl diester phosphodiesterase [Photobacterium damselae subsp. damselae]